MQHESHNMHTISRRTILKSIAALAATTACSPSLHAFASSLQAPASINPKWYGFNLLEYFSIDSDWTKYFPYKNDGAFQEDDFKWMRDWGFNWVRLPMDYRFWTDPNDLMKINEKMIEPIDRAIKLGEKYGIHVNLNLHHAPGECIIDGMDEKLTGIRVTNEKTSVYDNKATLDAFVHQWTYFAKRYAGISNDRLSFNLVNEPNAKNNTPAGEKDYIRVVRATVDGIRAIDPKRLIITDGFDVGRKPIEALYDTGILQSAHDYSPMKLTHYHVEWVRSMGSANWPVPTWPLKDESGTIYNKASIANDYGIWAEPAKHNIPIHFGELGCGRYTPAPVVHAWISDTLDVINDLHSGWALWNFRGPCGVLDTNRDGTEYKDWHGHKLDYKLLKILQDRIKA